MSWFQWSKVAGSNATADPSINLAEGMSPSSVNDSARAMMARAAEWRDDISGALTTTGTGTALVVATNQVFDTLAHMDGAMIAFIAHITNTGSTTLAVDGLTAAPIRSLTGTLGNLGAGVLVLGSPYVVTYKSAANEFLLHGFYGQPYAVPLGSFLFHSVATPPNSNFVLPIGQAISRTTYATYFAMVGTTFGVGNGTTTFNVPDLRSRLPIPLATMGGADPGLVTTAGSGIDGATIGATGGAQNVTLDATMIPAHTHPSPTISNPTHTHFVANGDSPVPGISAITSIGQARTNTGTISDYILAGSATVPSAGLTSPTAAGQTLGAATGSTGGSLAHNNMPPSIVLPILLRVF